MQDYPFDVGGGDQKENDENQKQPSFWSSLEKNQKIAVSFLAFFALAMIIIWAVELKRGLTEPFVYKEEPQTEATAANSQAAETEALKNKDTDGDGLSDWDELNTYKTSPYLEDSDSDGLKDKEEIAAGKDPNCPEGRICYGAGSGAATSSAGAATTSQQAELDRQIEGLDLSASSTISDTNIKKLLEGSLDAAALRKALLDSGMDKKFLDQFSDDELMTIYNSTKK